MTDLATYGIIDIMKKCFECEKTEDQIEIHDHHVVPRSMGGVKTIPLCYVCHAIVHDRSAVSIKELTKAALQNKKSRGYRVGTLPFGFTSEEDGKLVEDTTEQAIIQLVHAARNPVGGRRAAWRIIAEQLNANGYTNRLGNSWTKQNTYNVFRNRV